MKRGLTQTQLAHASGLHRTEISLLEHGKRTPLLETLVVISRGLGITPAELLGDLSLPEKWEHSRQRRVPWS
jgi:transcriptional regulator with XRE-family HTH domain